MSPNHRRQLREFYSQSFMTPEMLCLYCSRFTWNRGGRCSKEQYEDCHLFASEMADELAASPSGAVPRTVVLRGLEL